jgi:hypothetical protein
MIIIGGIKMEKIKRISAALIAVSMACGMMASCGSDSDTSSTTASKADTASTADTESTADDTADEEVSDYTPVYEYNGYDAFLMFADMNWFWGNWLGQGNVHNSEFDATDPASYGYGIDADITGDGEYTVSITKDSIDSNNDVQNANMDANLRTDAPAEGTVVFCVDIVGLLDGTEVSGLNKDTGEWETTAADDVSLDSSIDNHYDKHGVGDYKVSDLKVTVTSIKADGEEVEFDESKIRYGNIEDDNNCYRIEIYNDYGSTATDPAIDPLSLVFENSLEVTFTIEGLGDVKTFPDVTPFGSDDASATDDAATTTEDADSVESTEDTVAE